MNSSNSSKPPSSDPPWRKKDRGATPKKRPGGKIGHTGHGQKQRVPTDVQVVLPGPCRCGNMLFPKLEEYYTHQLIELPEIEMDVTHFVLHPAKCPCCGKMNKALIPPEYRAGFGPRLSAMIAEMAGTQADSRRMVQTFCASVLGVHISLGGIQTGLSPTQG